MKTGRRTLLNGTLTKKICARLSDGCDQKTACSICGIGERTYHNWKERGRNGEEPYASFFSAASRARDTHKARLLKIVIAAANKDARHAEWLLGKGWPREFGRDVIVAQEQTVYEPTRVIVNVHRDAESDAAVELFGERPKPSIC